VAFGKRPGIVQLQKSLSKITPARKKSIFFMLNVGVKCDKAARIAIKRDSLNAVPHVIAAAIRLCSELAATGKRAGIVQPQNHFMRKIPKTKTAATSSKIGGIPNVIKLRNFIIITFYKLSDGQGKRKN